MRAGPSHYTYPRTFREDVRRCVTHPLVLGLGIFYGAVLLGLWGGRFL